jgi:hypothetical protein
VLKPEAVVALTVVPPTSTLRVLTWPQWVAANAKKASEPSESLWLLRFAIVQLRMVASLSQLGALLANGWVFYWYMVGLEN